MVIKSVRSPFVIVEILEDIMHLSLRIFGQRLLSVFPPAVPQNHFLHPYILICTPTVWVGGKGWGGGGVSTQTCLMMT